MSCTVHLFDSLCYLLLVRRKLPLTHWFSPEKCAIGTERRAQVTPTCSICNMNNRSHGHNLKSTPDHAEPLVQYFFKNSTTGQSGIAVYKSILFHSILFYRTTKSWRPAATSTLCYGYYSDLNSKRVANCD